MDKEEARFILRCFRPDGSDAADPDFAEALRTAASDRELGEWLARERASDAEFSEKLERLALPDGLREEILAGLAAERGDRPVADEIDASLIGALATVGPPAGLRDEILTAMERSASPVEKSGGGWWRFGVPIAAAAGIALAFLAPGNRPESEGVAVGPESLRLGSAVPVSFVQERAIETLESDDFALDLKNRDHKALFKFIHDSHRVCPSGRLPDGLEKVPGLGCRVIEFDGKPGAIVCFKRADDEVVHLVVFRRSDVTGELPDRRHRCLEQQGRWAVARWEDDDRALMLLGTTSTEHLDELFGDR